jgi:cytochrome c oxidase subunit 4
MHVRYSDRMTWVFAGAGFFWLLILIGGTMSDVSTRPQLPSTVSIPAQDYPR